MSCYIRINGKEYRCAFTMLQLEIMSKLTEKQDSNTAIGACLPYTAIQMAARQDKKELDISFEDVLLWYDEAVSNDSEELKALNDAFVESGVYKKMAAVSGGDDKKK
jgi:hypothetical protein